MAILLQIININIFVLGPKSTDLVHFGKGYPRTILFKAFLINWNKHEHPQMVILLEIINMNIFVLCPKACDRQPRGDFIRFFLSSLVSASNRRILES